MFTEIRQDPSAGVGILVDVLEGDLFTVDTGMADLLQIRLDRETNRV